MGHMGMPEMILIALAVIVLFGAKRLPEIGGALGKAIREFKNAGKNIGNDVKKVIDDTST